MEGEEGDAPLVPAGQGGNLKDRPAERVAQEVDEGMEDAAESDGGAAPPPAKAQRAQEGAAEAAHGAAVAGAAQR